MPCGIDVRRVELRSLASLHLLISIINNVEGKMTSVLRGAAVHFVILDVH